MSRILSGAQEPKLGLAYELAKILGVSMDYLVDDALEADPPSQMVVLTEDEATILKIVRRLGASAAIDRLLRVVEHDPASQTAKPAESAESAEEEESKPYLHERSGRGKGRSHGGS